MDYTKEINKIVEGINFTNKTVKQSKKYKKVCEYCGEEFETNIENQKYCSRYHANKRRHEKQQQKKAEQETNKEVEIQPIEVKGTQKFMGKEIPVVEGGFGEGQKVVLAKTIAEIHEQSIDKVNELINNHLDEFEIGIDIINLKGNKEFETLCKGNGVYTQNAINKAKYIYLLSEQGYMLLVGFMRTDKAKVIRKQLRREYFAMRETLSQISEEDRTWLELRHAKQDNNAQYLIDLATKRIAGEFTKVLAQEIDGEGRRITLAELADKLSRFTDFEVESINITNFLVYKGYLVKKQFPRRGSFVVDGVVIGRLEKNYHRQPTNLFLTEFANKGLALTKPADERGKIVWEFTNRFEKYFEENFLEDFIYYVTNTEKGWE